ncbi:CAF17-like 4Fe-4S cluster assembly/insertion protein YgfZ [Phycisphaera mikurensis]|uniref:Aminomethyltransferase folate-binding domain-containing protein n=1 Tax=Phycisphaera mikurensis (strain NBRC 102666 / KCTC 22515 / FYK2301M01) TaxID=1142394 RepID=I0IDS3_PHYMF|nr:glycine cleavage T C-terminal barrel domain-containing protein [Phycisphaera mikurensis]MBB6441223.1 folate-binding protein YgfZ [Phycisphaera mikurensis]BAM03411.1 hypothetical protein PSMK_12520 [Phycisphaera mikurensis NBRC 102666]
MAAAPLQPVLESLGAELSAWGPPLDPQRPEGGPFVVQSFGETPAEYAAIKRHAGLFPVPGRTLLEVTGGDARDLLNRLATQDLLTPEDGAAVRTLFLGSRGLILADAFALLGEGRVLLDLDTHDAAETLGRLEAARFAEDVAFAAADPPRVPLMLLGPAAAAGLRAAGAEDAAALPPGRFAEATVAGHTLLVHRGTDAGVPSFRLHPTGAGAAAVFAALLAALGYAGEPADAADPAAAAARRRAGLRGRPVGWEAFNTARVEAGQPLFHLDYGPGNLVAEAQLVEEAVSFTKGCYPGQEAVARMKNLGHPKKLLVRLEVEEDDRLPSAGTEVLDPSDPGRVIGAVTSSTPSPLRGGRAVALAVVRWGRHKPGQEVRVAADAGLCAAVVQPLR